jgi:hypothetical protein
MERDSGSSCVFSAMAGDGPVFRGFGLCRMFLTVEADRKMFSNSSWLVIRIRPQLTLALVISQTSEAISAGVLFATMDDLVAAFRRGVLHLNGHRNKMGFIFNHDDIHKRAA